jgi:hypothetical protein
MVRTQLYLDDELHRQLRELALRQGRTVSELVREALARVYGSADIESRLTSLRGIAGLWRNRTGLGSTARFVRKLRKGTQRRARAST